MSIRTQVSSGIKWVTVSLLLTRAARFLTTIVLARLLAPEMFGLVAMANVTIETIGTIREIGFGAAYIQRIDENADQDRLAADTTFFVGLAFNLVLFFLCTLSAPMVADFFKSRELQNILRMMFFTFILDAVGIVPSLILHKRLDFGKHAICEITQVFFYASIGIALSVMDFGVWSLVFAQLGSKSVFAVLVFKLSGWCPRLQFCTKIATELFSYGKYIWTFVMLSAVGAAIDKALIGRFWGAASLAFYEQAFYICNLPVTQITFTVSRITFPAFSKLQHDRDRLRKAFMQTLSHVSIVTLPISFGLMAVSRVLILSVYGNKWEQIIPLIGVLAIYGMLRSISSITGAIFKAIGKPNILLYTSIIHHIALISLLFYLRKYGVIGICYAVLIPLIISSIIAFVLVIPILALSVKETLEPIIRSGISSATMYGIIRMFAHTFELHTNLPVALLLILYIGLGISVYFILSLIFNRINFLEFKNTFTEIVSIKAKAI